MDKLSIHGGATLNGEVRISGAKNAALPILTAALLAAEPLRLSNVPNLKDVSTLLALLGHMGVSILRDPDGKVVLNAKDIALLVAPYDMVKTMPYHAGSFAWYRWRAYVAGLGIQTESLAHERRSRCISNARTSS